MPLLSDYIMLIFYFPIFIFQLPEMIQAYEQIVSIST